MDESDSVSDSAFLSANISANDTPANATCSISSEVKSKPTAERICGTSSFSFRIGLTSSEFCNMGMTEIAISLPAPKVTNLISKLVKPPLSKFPSASNSPVSL